MTRPLDAHRCAVCGRPKPDGDRGWNSSGTWWCDVCTDAYTRSRESERTPGAPQQLGPLPAYLVPAAMWPSIGFDPADLDPFLPSGHRTPDVAEATG